MTRRRALGFVACAALGGTAAAQRPFFAVGAAASAATGFALLTLSPSLLGGALIVASFLSRLAVPFGQLALRPETIVGAALLAILPFRRDAGSIPRWSGLAVLWLVAGLVGAIDENLAGAALVHGARLFATLAPLIVLPALLRSESAIRRAWDLYLTAIAATCGLGLLALGAHIAWGSELGITRQEYLGYVHPHGPLLEPNLLGALAAIGTVVFLMRAFAVDVARRWRWIFLAGALLALAAVAASLTRAAWLAVLVVGPLALLTAAPTPATRRRRIVLFVALLALAGAALLSIAALLAPPGWSDARTGVAGKTASLLRLEDDPNVRVRFRSYDAALAIWRQNPWFGAGHGAMERGPGLEDKTLFWAGNLEVHLLADSGMVGTTAFLALVIVAALRAARFRPRTLAIERLAALAVLFTCAQATDSSWLAMWWVPLGLILARSDPPTNERRRLLFVHPSDELYGSDRVLLELVTRLDRARYDLTVLISNDLPYSGQLTHRLRAEGVVVDHLRIGVLRRAALRPRRLPRYAFDVVASTLRLWRRIAGGRFDLVHVNTVTVFPAAIAARLAGRPLIWHVHEIVTDRPGRGILHALVKTLATRVVTVSEAARADLDPSGRDARIVVVTNGIPILDPPPWPAPDQPPTAVFLGRISARKGPQVLLEAFAEVRKRIPTAQLVFAGDELGGGDDLQRLLETRAAALRLPVEFRPFRNEVRETLSRAHLLVAPSLQPESFGLVLVEAMAAGRPVVASALGGPREIVVDGETGRLVPAGDAAQLAAAIADLLADPVMGRALGEAGRDRALRLYDVRRMAAEMTAVYEQLLGDRQGVSPVWR